MGELRHDAAERPLRQQGAGDADEFRYASINAADAGEHVAQREIEEALHGGQQDGHVEECRLAGASVRIFRVLCPKAVILRTC